jgi:DNA-binding IclR family transcriptional regulator
MSDLDALLGVAAGFIGGLAAAKLISYLVERDTLPSNRYQAGVATQQPAAEVARALEALTEEGYVRADGDPESPNERTYRLTVPA